ncbi:MAG: hypothetical protein ABEI06_02800, partial [Halobacteriaceae archaeon]
SYLLMLLIITNISVWQLSESVDQLEHWHIDKGLLKFILVNYFMISLEKYHQASNKLQIFGRV